MYILYILAAWLGITQLKFFCIIVVFYYMYLFFLVLSDVNYLPRYKYHKSLLQLFKEGLPPNPVFHDSYFGNCFIIIGGEFDEESKLQVFGDTLLETVTVNDSPEG